MNKTINHLTLIADAAEYFDRSTGAAWQIRSALVNAGVWAANAVVSASRGDNVEFKAKSAIKLATIRVWLRDSISSGFILDLTPSAVHRTLGLHKEIDPHEEAVREARAKCQRTRSATRFSEYYQAALTLQEIRRQEREQRVEEIANLLADKHTLFDHDVADYMQAHLQIDVTAGELVADEALYDDNEVERELDSLETRLGNVLPAMYRVCDAALTNTLVVRTIDKLSGYLTAIKQMMEIVGIDVTKLQQRQETLDAQINAQVEVVSKTAKDVDAEIAEQLAALNAAPKQPTQPQRTLVKSPARLAREAEATAAAEARKAEDEQHAKRSAAAKRGAATRKANSLKDLGALVQ